MRLDHFLALSQVGTKKKVREIIYNGEITLNGTTCMVPATTIDPSIDCVTHKDISLSMNPVYYVLHKPQNCLTVRDAQCHTVFDCLSEVDTPGLFAVGRLDKDTEGLLFLTNDGDFSNQLMSPHYHMPKTYTFLALGTLTSENKQLLENGMDIGSTSMTKPAQVRVIKEGLYVDLSSEIGSNKMKRIKKQPLDQPAFIGEIIISEGKKHQVKRMLRGVHCPIIYLKRVAIGGYHLPASLALGDYMEIGKDELLDMM